MITIKTNIASVTLALLCMAISPVLSSCSDESAPEMPDTNTNMLSINGDCNVYEIGSAKSGAWSIASAPDWITPVAYQGGAGDKLQIYVESNTRSPRSGEIVIRYSDGSMRSVAVKQSEVSDSQSTTLERNRAVGWSFDIRSYMDFRGLKEQVINTQKLNNTDNDFSYRAEVDPGSHSEFYYGESSQTLADNMTANMTLGGKFNSFSMELQGAFGKNALSDSHRIYSRVRSVQQLRHVYILNFDRTDVQTLNLFTADFAAARKKVIDSKGSDEAIRDFIERYGTHLVTDAYLGGYYDYYFSSILENKSDVKDIKGAVEFGFSQKFKLKGDANYKDDFAKLNNERIEKAVVKGGDAIAFTLAVESGTISDKTASDWLNSLKEGQKFELLNFKVIALSALFPDEIENKINSYTDRMYYSEIPLTRSEK